MDFSTESYRVFELFKKNWALVTAGTMEAHNACTIGWGSMGTAWTRPGHSGHTITVYIHPGRDTQEFMQRSDTFTVSFFPAQHRDALNYMGTHSGRQGDKATAAGLTPVAMGEGVTYAEAELTFLCRTLYRAPLQRDALAAEVQEYYRAYPTVYPVDETGEWQPHWIYVGEVVDVQDRRDTDV